MHYQSIVEQALSFSLWSKRLGLLASSLRLKKERNGQALLFSLWSKRPGELKATDSLIAELRNSKALKLRN